MGIKLETRRRYRLQLWFFFRWMRRWDWPFPSNAGEMDVAISEFVNSMWLNGDPYGYACDVVSGMGRFLPQCRKKLVVSRQYLRNWSSTLHRKRAFPISSSFLQALVGCALAYEDEISAALLAVGFACMLRTEELLLLCPMNVQFSAPLHQAFITLESTKTSRWKNSAEVVYLSDPSIVRLLYNVCAAGEPSRPIFAGKAKEFSSVLRSYALRLGFRHPRLSLYSLRRGGAAWHFATWASYDKTCEAGRWAQIRTARIYIDGAIAEHRPLCLSHSHLERMTKAQSFARHYLASLGIQPGLRTSG